MDETESEPSFRSKLELPLAELIRPTTLLNYIGQRHLINDENGAISNFLWMGYIPSMILYGPPGVGKTTLAHIMAQHVGYVFLELSATNATVAELRELSSEIRGENTKRTRMGNPRLRVVVFIDEIHRFSKIQQDFLLPFIEAGDFVFIGATTVDPQKRIRRAILSRCQLFQLQPLSSDDVVTVLRKAALYENIRRKMSANLRFISYEEGSFEVVADYSNGDTRTAINFIELISSWYNKPECLISNLNDPIVVGAHEVDAAVKSLTKARLGLRHYHNIPLFQQLFDAMNGVLSYEHTMEEPEKLLVQLKHLDESFVVSINIRAAQEALLDVDEIHQGKIIGALDVSDNLVEQNWAEHIEFSDDSDVELGQVYSDTETDTQLPLFGRASVPTFRSTSAIHTLLLLLSRGESEFMVLKQILLFVCLYVLPEFGELPKIMAVVKTMRSSTANPTITLSNCVERLSGIPKCFRPSIVKAIRQMKNYLSRGKIPDKKTTELKELTVFYDTELENTLLNAPLDGAQVSEETPDAFKFSVVDETSPGEDYSFGWQANTTFDI